MGFADVTGDGKPEALIVFPGTLIFMDMANPEGRKALEFARLAPSYPIASSFEVNWPQVIAKSPDGDFSYTRDASGIWMAEPLNWEPEPEDY